MKKIDRKEKQPNSESDSENEDEETTMNYREPRMTAKTASKIETTLNRV